MTSIAGRVLLLLAEVAAGRGVPCTTRVALVKSDRARQHERGGYGNRFQSHVEFPLTV